MNGKLDRPGGALHFEVIDATPPWLGEAPPLIVFHHGIGATADIWAEWLPALVDRFRIARFNSSHGPACGRALRAFLDRRVPSAA